MSIEADGTTIVTTETGFLENPEDWTESVARAMAGAEDLELNERHWDIIQYLREEYFSNNGNQPNNRTLIKEMSARWGHKVSNKELFELFPGIQANRPGGFPGFPKVCARAATELRQRRWPKPGKLKLAPGDKKNEQKTGIDPQDAQDAKGLHCPGTAGRR